MAARSPLVVGSDGLPQQIQAGDFVAGAPLSFRNLLRNPAFVVNQRAVSGTVTLAAGAYGHDGVKAGATGATYTFSASGVDTVLTITAGSLIMPIEAGMMEGGAYALAHDGSALVRVWQGTGNNGSGAYASAARASGGLITPALTAATQANVEFSLGTVLRPQLESGACASIFERLPFDVTYARNRRYFQRTMLPPIQFAVAGYWINVIGLSTPMRAAPTATPFGSPIYNGAANGTINTATTDAIAFQMQITSSTGGYVLGYWVDLSAEI